MAGAAGAAGGTGGTGAGSAGAAAGSAGATGGVARVYAEAIFRLAKERRAIDEVLEDLRTVRESLRASPKFQTLIEAPGLGTDRTEKAIHAVFGETVSEPVLHLLLLLVRKRRQKALAKIVEAYEEMVAQERRERRVAVATASALDDDARARLAEVLARKIGARVVLDTRVDPTLLGGVVARVGDTLIDGSLKAELARLSRRMKEGTNEKGQRS